MMMMQKQQHDHRAVHVFDNGVRVYDDHLLPVQRERYRKRNVHEASEEDVFVDLIRRLPAAGCYVDVGCAIGYYPLLAKRLAPGVTVHAVEPLARHRKCFLENARLNGLSDSAFVLHPVAVSSDDGEAKLLDQDYGSALVRGTTKAPPAGGVIGRFLARLGLLRHSAAREQRGGFVRTTTLDALVAKIGRRVDLVQMDVQGFEIDALLGAPRSLRSGAIRTFLIGTHGAEVHGRCERLLSRSGYAVGLSLPEAPDQPDGILVASKG
jgi:FkbM family methyltransferase